MRLKRKSFRVLKNTTLRLKHLDWKFEINTLRLTLRDYHSEIKRCTNFRVSSGWYFPLEPPSPETMLRLEKESRLPLKRDCKLLKWWTNWWWVTHSINFICGSVCTAIIWSDVRTWLRCSLFILLDRVAIKMTLKFNFNCLVCLACTSFCANRKC